MLLIIALLLFAVAVYLFIFFVVKRDRGHREPKGALFAAMGFGLLGFVLAGALEFFLIPSALTDSRASGVALPPLEIVGATMLIGLIEESLKTIPLALFLYRKKYFDELTDGVIYFGIAALSFGVVEDIFYALEFGGGTGILRVILSPYVHVGFAILFGLALAYRKVLRRSIWLVVGGFTLAVISHGLFDFFGYSGTVTGALALAIEAIVLNISVFMLFRHAQRGDEARGESTIGINRYCRHCGTPNPLELLHCSHCGKLS